MSAVLADHEQGTRLDCARQKDSVTKESKGAGDEDGKPQAKKLYLEIGDSGFRAFARSGYGAGLPDSPRVDCRTYISASSVQVLKCFFRLSRKMKLPQISLNGSTFLHRFLKKEEASAKIVFPKSVSTTVEAWLFSFRIAHLSKFMNGGRLC